MQGNLLFRSENEFARGVARRPRGLRRPSPTSPSAPSTPSSHDESLPDTLKQRPTRTVTSHRAGSQGPEPGVNPSLSPSLEDRAICYYAHDRLGTLPSNTDNINSCLKKFLLQPERPSNSKSSLNLALQAASLAAFGRKIGNHSASSAAIEAYGRALRMTSVAILDAKSGASDELLHTVMLLFSYEVSDVRQRAFERGRKS